MPTRAPHLLLLSTAFLALACTACSRRSLDVTDFSKRTANLFVISGPPTSTTLLLDIRGNLQGKGEVVIYTLTSTTAGQRQILDSVPVTGKVSIKRSIPFPSPAGMIEFVPLGPVSGNLSIDYDF